jgi:hypothetical protein
LDARWNSTRATLRSHVFRIWTAAVFLAAYAYAWVYSPEALTWWKRSTEAGIEAVCGWMPYPWGDRIEATIGNFGLWVQITLGIVVFRLLVWLVMTGVRTGFRRRR